MDVIELRAYARAKRALDEAESEGDVPQNEMTDWVWRIQHELLKERNARRRAGQG